MTVSDKINLCLTLITIFIAVVALYQTNKQIRLSNKQHLFDRRLKSYRFFKELIDLYDKSIIYLNDAYKDVIAAFNHLTNSANLETMSLVVKREAAEDDRIVFLTKCEEFESEAIEVRCIWSFKEVNIVNMFIKNYKELLKTLYRQHLEISNLKNSTKDKTFEDYLSQLKSSAEKVGLIQIIDSINNSYNQLKNEKIEEKLLRELKLK